MKIDRQEPTLRVGGITPMTTIDYPGELAAVVFCQGCPWHCSYCHNTDLLPGRGQNEVPWEQVLELLKRRRGLLDAVVFSGGEPTLQGGLADAIRQVKALGYKVGLHSAGSYPVRLERVLPMVDWVGLDIKALPQDYQKVTGVPGSGEAAWGCARRLIAAGVAHEIRITVDPALLSQEQVDEMVQRLYDMGAERVTLQPCRKPLLPM
jgi:pyruvate formate lyase activating enzyme